MAHENQNVTTVASATATLPMGIEDTKRFIRVWNKEFDGGGTSEEVKTRVGNELGLSMATAGSYASQIRKALKIVGSKKILKKFKRGRQSGEGGQLTAEGLKELEALL